MVIKSLNDGIVVYKFKFMMRYFDFNFYKFLNVGCLQEYDIVLILNWLMEFIASTNFKV